MGVDWPNVRKPTDCVTIQAWGSAYASYIKYIERSVYLKKML